MTLPAVIARIAELQGVLASPVSSPRGTAVPAPGSPDAGSFAQVLDGSAAVPRPRAADGGTSAGRAMVGLARGEVGVTEQPPGSNDSPRISQFRLATAGSGVGPWCAYFTSWLAREAGVPLGDSGQGFGRVDDVWAWAERSGKAMPVASASPQPGDLIVWDEHIGIVEAVGTDGSITTIEGNSSNMVARRQHAPGGDGAIGYVRLG